MSLCLVVHYFCAPNPAPASSPPGHELLINPSMLLLDEPTSGLGGLCPGFQLQ